MHIGEAIMPRDEAVALARETLVSSLERLGHYYAKQPSMRPDPDCDLPELAWGDETWIYISFRRADPKAEPLVVRVNGISRTASIERVIS